MSLPAPIIQHLGQNYQMRVDASRSIGGGCIHHAQAIETQQGTYFLKYNQAQQAHNFEVERKGLALLRDSGAVKVPEVIGTHQLSAHAYFLAEFIPSGTKAPAFWKELGSSLAQLHQKSAEKFGLDHDNYIGALPQSNTQCESWADFYQQERLVPMVRMARTKGLLDKQDLQRFDELYQRLPDLISPEPPALIHGDLWGGNLMSNAEGAPVLIDPAVYYGHREVELAFMTLFDRQPPAFYEAYQEEYPLAPDWESRIQLYLLYPLLVHVNLFGTGYVGSLRNALRLYI